MFAFAGLCDRQLQWEGWISTDDAATYVFERARQGSRQLNSLVLRLLLTNTVAAERDGMDSSSLTIDSDLYTDGERSVGVGCVQKGTELT